MMRIPSTKRQIGDWQLHRGRNFLRVAQNFLILTRLLRFANLFSSMYQIVLATTLEYYHESYGDVNEVSQAEQSNCMDSKRVDKIS